MVADEAAEPRLSQAVLPFAEVADPIPGRSGVGLSGVDVTVDQYGRSPDQAGCAHDLPGTRRGPQYLRPRECGFRVLATISLAQCLQLQHFR